VKQENCNAEHIVRARETRKLPEMRPLQKTDEEFEEKKKKE
jgi:hypothetical protein